MKVKCECDVNLQFIAYTDPPNWEALEITIAAHKCIGIKQSNWQEEQK